MQEDKSSFCVLFNERRKKRGRHILLGTACFQTEHCTKRTAKGRRANMNGQHRRRTFRYSPNHITYAFPVQRETCLRRSQLRSNKLRHIEVGSKTHQFLIPHSIPIGMGSIATGKPKYTSLAVVCHFRHLIVRIGHIRWESGATWTVHCVKDASIDRRAVHLGKQSIHRLKPLGQMQMHIKDLATSLVLGDNDLGNCCQQFSF
mmetsp:Transcript_16803/g.48276  ORF Transcript_16803/g.48276 Transcript_16803/m.48276 type:complete len:203 (+) Transcript_16803:647-1255(+)